MKFQEFSSNVHIPAEFTLRSVTDIDTDALAIAYIFKELLECIFLSYVHYL